MKFSYKGKKSFNVAIMGATGAVGEEMLSILIQRKFPCAQLKLLASSRSAGKKYDYNGRTLIVEEMTEASFDGVDIVLASAGGSLSKKYAPIAVSKGAVVIDNTSAFRMDPKCPLVVPEINASDIRDHQGIIANPNCSTIIMLLPVAAVHKVNPIKRIIVSTYQAASGAGAKAMQELENQSREILAGQNPSKNVFPHQIAFNLFSHNSAIKEDGFNEEEHKMIHETHKIMCTKKIRVSATTVRVPVYRAHSEAIYMDLSKPVNLKALTKSLGKAKGVRLVDDRKKNYFPMPIEASGQDDVLVGRLREDLTDKKALWMFVAGDQLRKGAALNAVQIAEKLVGLSR